MSKSGSWINNHLFTYTPYIVTLKSSLKLVPFESLGAVSYSLSIVTMAVSVTVCEIVNVRVV